MQIKNYPEATSLLDDDYLLIQSGSITKKIKASTLNIYTENPAPTPTNEETDIMASQYLLIKDIKNTGVAGGNFASTNWQVRTLNTVEFNQIYGASLIEESKIILPTGTYIVDIRVPAYWSGMVTSKLSKDDGTLLIQGTSDYSHNASNVSSVSNQIIGRIILSAQTTVKIEQRCDYLQSFGGGLGLATGLSSSEVYTIAQFWKVA